MNLFSPQKGGDQSLRKRRVIRERGQFETRRIAPVCQYQGNYWERSITDSELTILYYFWIVFAYIFDFLMEIYRLKFDEQVDFKQIPLKLKDFYNKKDKYPETQGLRKMVKIQNNIWLVLMILFLQIFTLKTNLVLTGSCITAVYMK